MVRSALEILLALAIFFVILAWATDEVGWAAVAVALMGFKLTILLSLAHLTRR